MGVLEELALSSTALASPIRAATVAAIAIAVQCG